MNEGDKLDIADSEKSSPDSALTVPLECADLLKSTNPSQNTHQLRETDPQDELDQGLAEQNIYGANERTSTTAQLEKDSTKNNEDKAQSDKYLPDKLTDKQFEELKDLKKTRQELEAIRHEINTFGEEPEEAVVNLMKTNRAVGVADGAHVLDGPQRIFGAKIMSKIKAAGATHFAIELPESTQAALDEYMKTEKLQVDKLPELLRGNNYLAMLEAARKAGLIIVAADPLQNVDGRPREEAMAGAIGDILAASQTNKVFWWVGDGHLNVPPNTNRRAAGLLRQKYKIATVGQQTTDSSDSFYLGKLASDVKDTVAISTTKAKELGKLPVTNYLASLLSYYYGNFDYIILHPTKKEH